MPLHPALIAASLVCGLAVGLAIHRLVKERLAEADALLAERTASRRQPLRAAGLLLTPLALGAASVGLALLPGLREPVALSQALLMLYLLAPLALVDLLTLTVEPAIVLGGMALRLAAIFALQRSAAADMLGGLLAGAGLLTVVGFAYQWLRGREGLGDGDAAVLGLIGAFVGWRGLLPVVLLATVAGLLVGVPLLLALRRPLNTPLPFAPFLCLSGLAVFLAQVQGWRLFGLLPALG